MKIPATPPQLAHGWSIDCYVFRNPKKRIEHYECKDIDALKVLFANVYYQLKGKGIRDFETLAVAGAGHVEHCRTKEIIWRWDQRRGWVAGKEREC